MIIRNALKSDAKAICNIYNHYVENTIITFEELHVTESEMVERIESISNLFPFLVVEANNIVAGYAYANQWKPRSAYRFTVEITIYIAPKYKGKGIGSILLPTLIEKLKIQGVHALVGGISLPNDASVSLHEKFGFKKVAHFKDIGYKFEKWIDVGYWELIMD